jgi:hypothetical protein
VTGENANTLATEGIPDVAGPVIVAAEENATRDGERNRGDTAEDVVVREDIELTVSTNIKQTTRGIVGTSGECITVREEAITYV